MKTLADREIKARLLLDAAEKDVHQFLQIDGFMDMWGDDVTRPDSDGDCISSLEVDELRRLHDVVRIQIPIDCKRQDALRILRKMVQALEESTMLDRLKS
jgi:hypothetical protein